MRWRSCSGCPPPSSRLARRSGRRGIISRSVLPDGDHALVHGNELLQQHDPDYDRDQVREAAGYRLSAVWQALAGHAAPAGAPLGIVRATSGRRLERWAARGTSSYFEGRPSLVQLAVEALARLDAGSAASWRARRADLDLDAWREGVARVPVELMSHGDRMLAFELVRWNRERLLTCLPA